MSGFLPGTDKLKPQIQSEPLQDNFTFCNKDLVTSSVLKKKKKSPSQIWREAKRKLERHKKEKPEDTVKVSDSCSMSKFDGISDFEEATHFKCPECE